MSDDEVGGTLSTSSDLSRRAATMASRRRVNSSITTRHTKRAAIVSWVLDKSSDPSVVGSLWPETDARSFVEPEAAPLRSLCRDFQPIPTPNSVAPPDVHLPTRSDEHLANAAIAVAAIASGEPHNRSRQDRFIVWHHQLPPLRRTRPPYDTASRHECGADARTQPDRYRCL